jgi:hypothetical protein
MGNLGHIPHVGSRALAAYMNDCPVDSLGTYYRSMYTIPVRTIIKNLFHLLPGLSRNHFAPLDYLCPPHYPIHIVLWFPALPGIFSPLPSASASHAPPQVVRCTSILCRPTLLPPHSPLMSTSQLQPSTLSPYQGLQPQGVHQRPLVYFWRVSIGGYHSNTVLDGWLKPSQESVN